MRALFTKIANLDACCQIWPHISDQLVRENDARAAHAKRLSMWNIIVRIATETSAANVSRNVGVDVAQEFYKQVKLKMKVIVNADEKVVVVSDRVEICIQLEGFFLRRVSIIVDIWEG